jgi:hypothetical protein
VAVEKFSPAHLALLNAALERRRAAWLTKKMKLKSGGGIVAAKDLGKGEFVLVCLACTREMKPSQPAVRHHFTSDIGRNSHERMTVATWKDAAWTDNHDDGRFFGTASQGAILMSAERIYCGTHALARRTMSSAALQRRAIRSPGGGAVGGVL